MERHAAEAGASAAANQFAKERHALEQQAKADKQHLDEQSKSIRGLEHELHDTQARLKAAEAEIAHLRALLEMAKRPAEGP